MLKPPFDTNKLPPDIRAVQVELPRLEPDSREACKVDESRIRAYLEEGFEDPIGSLAFIRTASIEGFHYWLWRADTGEGPAYISVEEFGKTITTRADLVDDLTPEQYLARVFLDSWMGISL